MSHSLFSIAFGVGTRNRTEQWLEVFFPKPLLQPSSVFIERVKAILGYESGNQIIDFNFATASDLASALKYIAPEQSALLVRLAESHKPTVACILEHDLQPASVPEAYLKLQLISHRLCKPNEINMTDVFKILPNVAWTNRGAIDINEVAEQQLEERIKGRMLNVFSVDKLPKLTDYVVPKGIHIADAASVRLGAYVGEGTVVPPESSINFNAGVGISLGNRNTVETGLWLTGDTPVTMLDNTKQVLKTVLASELALKNDLSFYRNPETGAVECTVAKAE